MARPKKIEFRPLIRAALAERGWQIVDLAAVTRVSTSVWYRYLKGETEIRARPLEDGLTALGFRVRPPPKSRGDKG